MAEGDSFKSGWASVFGCAEEATLGTYATATATAPFNSQSLNLNREKVRIEAINGSRDYHQVFQSTEQIEGSIEMDLNIADDIVCYILKQAMGGTVASSATPTTTAVGYTHVFYTGDMESNDSTVSASDMKALSFYLRYGNTSANGVAFYGNRVNQLTIRGEMGQPVRITAEIIGKGASATTHTITVSYNSQMPLLFDGVSIYEADNVASITSGTSLKFQSFELGINNNIASDDESRALGSRQVDILPPGRREVTLTLGQRYDTTTAWSRGIDDTISAIRISCVSSSTITSDTGSTVYSCHFDLPYCKWVSPLPEVSDAGVLTHELEVMPHAQNTSTGYSIRVTAHNATSGY